MSLQQIEKDILTKSTIKWFPIYIEHARVCQNEFGITVYYENGSKSDLPVAIFSSILLGPGTSITHGAISICANCNCIINWVGENGIIYHATGATPTTSNKNAMKQCEMRFGKERRLDVVRRLFLERYPTFDVSQIDIKNVMGFEGDFVKKTYEALGQKYGVAWRGRRFNHNNFCASDNINKALSFSNYVLYSACFSVILSNGFLPSIGFIHNGSMLDFVLDIADVFKDEMSIDTSFQSVSLCMGFNEAELKSLLYKKLNDCRFFDKATKFIYKAIYGEEPSKEIQ